VANLKTQAAELVDRERQLAERQMRELAVCTKEAGGSPGILGQ
jgi:hypothetical protein